MSNNLETYTEDIAFSLNAILKNQKELKKILAMNTLALIMAHSRVIPYPESTQKRDVDYLRNIIEEKK